jgi:hypothetical protein
MKHTVVTALSLRPSTVAWLDDLAAHVGLSRSAAADAFLTRLSMDPLPDRSELVSDEYRDRHNLPGDRND